MVGKISQSAKYDFEPWRRFIKRHSFEPDPRLDKVEESVVEVPWYTDVHRIPVSRLLERYGGSLNKGLTEFQVARNRHRYGANIIPTSTIPFSVKVWTLLKACIFGLNSLIWICLIFSLTIFAIRWICLQEKPIEHLIFAGVLLLAILVTTISFYYQSQRTERMLSSASGLGSQCTLARRNGRFLEVPSCELVVGDVIQLSYGDVIPADIRIFESHEFFVDNSGLTGESDPKRRRSICTDENPMETKNLAFFSTYALEGFAKGVVVNVGVNTLMGRVAEEASRINFKSDSPVQKELDKLVKLLILQALCFGTFFFCVSMILGYSWKDGLIYVMTVIVANVPEGLALTSTILLASQAAQLREQNCVVKNLHAIETLGATTCICTDKTGSLTQNKMAIAHLWFDDRMAEADTSEFLDGHQFTLDDPGFKALARVARLCSRARFKPYQMDKPVFRREVQGDASEAAILRFMEAHLGSVTKYRRKYKKIYELPFNSRTKLQAFVYEIPEHQAKGNGSTTRQHYLTVKGAPEKLFDMCTSILIKDTAYTLDDKWRAKFHQVLEKLGSIGDRVIGLADALLPREKYNESYNYDNDKPDFFHVGLRFIGLMSMIDPPRAAVPEAVGKLKKAGVKVVMITGDHPITAEAIALATGIFKNVNKIQNNNNFVPSQIEIEIETATNCERVFSGKDLMGIEPGKLDAILSESDDIIFARTTPEQKFVIVQSLQRLGHKVTVVGDGVNDGPAIKRSDVGIVMGVTGSEVSKEIADMVLLDDNFATVVQGIEEGRRGFDNLSKLLRYTMADNIAQMYCAGLSILCNFPKPFAAMAMLLTVLGTDLLPAISLCYEPIERKENKKTEGQSRGHGQELVKSKSRLITFHLLSHIYAQVAIMEVLAGFFAYFATMSTYGFSPVRLFKVSLEWNSPYVNDLEDDIFRQEWTFKGRKRLETHCQSVFFIAIVVMQVANVVICKGSRNSISSAMLINWRTSVAICFELAIAALLLYLPKISFVTGLVAIAPIEWLYAIPFALLLILLDEIRRYSLRRNWLDSSFRQVILH